ncbi:MAG: hypothetical protein ACE5PV_21000 [Candidatus Poribacteria bacterium]
MSNITYELMNEAYKLIVTTGDREVNIHLKDLAMAFDLADSAYIYRASRACEEGSIVAKWLNDVKVEVSGEVMKLTGALLGLKVEHVLKLPVARAIMEERITLRNPTDSVVALPLECKSVLQMRWEASSQT